MQQQVWTAVDPAGETRELIDAVTSEGVEIASWMGRLGVDLDDTLATLGTVGAEYRSLIASIAESVRVLGPRGWAVMYMQTEVTARAVALVGEGRGDEADDLLAGQWEGEGEWRLKRICDRVGTMGAGDDELKRLYGERARLLTLARAHHLAGRYDASVPILQAQMEGLTMDVTDGSKFFTKAAAKADLVDPKELVSIAAALSALQATYGQDVRETQTAGSLSRHGVLHGRELAYDTRVNSAKTWSVMDALVQWGLPRAREVTAARRAERQAAYAGAADVDDRGRRLDDREVAETRNALRLVASSALGHHNRVGGFRHDIVGGVYGASDFVKRGLPPEHRMEQAVRADGQEAMYWRRTVSGWVLGIAVTFGEGHFGEYLYSAPEDPSGFATERAPGWAALFGTPPEWT